MILKRFIFAAIALGSALALVGCGGANEANFSGYVADHWPHWAGGLPEDAPPRPGAPGYNEFISHGGADQTAAASPPVTFQKLPPGGTKTVAQPIPPAKTMHASQPAPAQQAPAVEEAPPVDAPSEDASVVKGGLY